MAFILLVRKGIVASILVLLCILLTFAHPIMAADDAINVDIDSLPGTGEIQAQDTILTSASLTLGVWRDNLGYVKTIPISNGEIQWALASGWSGPVSMSSLPGSGLAGFVITGYTMRVNNSYVIGNTVTQAFWNENAGYYRTVPISSGVIQWGSAGSWNGPVYPTGLPEGKAPDATIEYIIGNKLRQVIWQFNRSYYRDADIINGSPVFPCSNASCWVQPYSNLGFNALTQAAGAFVINNTLQEIVWVGGNEYRRVSSIVNGQLSGSSLWRSKQEISPNISGTSPGCFLSVQNTTNSTKNITGSALSDSTMVDSIVWQRADWKTTQTGCTQVPPNVTTTDALWNQCTQNPTSLTVTANPINFNVSLVSGTTHAIRVGLRLKGSKEPIWSGMPWGYICYVKRN